MREYLVYFQSVLMGVVADGYRLIYKFMLIVITCFIVEHRRTHSMYKPLYSKCTYFEQIMFK